MRVRSLQRRAAAVVVGVTVALLVQGFWAPAMAAGPRTLFSYVGAPGIGSVRVRPTR